MDSLRLNGSAEPWGQSWAVENSKKCAAVTHASSLPSHRLWCKQGSREPAEALPGWCTQKAGNLPSPSADRLSVCGEPDFTTNGQRSHFSILPTHRHPGKSLSRLQKQNKWNVSFHITTKWLLFSSESQLRLQLKSPSSNKTLSTGNKGEMRVCPPPHYKTHQYNMVTFKMNPTP